MTRLELTASAAARDAVVLCNVSPIGAWADPDFRAAVLVSIFPLNP